jgi:hypothetical protein
MIGREGGTFFAFFAESFAPFATYLSDASRKARKEREGSAKGAKECCLRFRAFVAINNESSLTWSKSKFNDHRFLLGCR